MITQAIIIGATSGIGREVALLLLKQGWRLGIAGRREERLQEIKAAYPTQVVTKAFDVTSAEADCRLRELLAELGDAELIFIVSGIGFQNTALDCDIELRTVATNAEGFTRMATAAFNYFEGRGCGQLAAISSIAGTRGLGAAPAYSATKRFQSTYLQALSQLAHIKRLPIAITDIRLGFVDTDLLRGGHYPMLMDAPRVARHIVKAIARRKRIYTYDLRYRLLVFFWRLIPRCLWERLRVGGPRVSP